MNQNQINELSYVKDLLESILNGNSDFDCCDIDKLLQNINYL